jgi:phosphate transport system substrate-binding protein
LPTPCEDEAKLTPTQTIRRRQVVLKRFHLLAAIAVVALAAAATGVAATGGKSGGTLSGAGSSFVNPLVSAWVQPFESASGIHVNYNPIGSGGGIAAITNRTVDFGASDAPMTPDQLIACKGCLEIPWALGATAVMYHLDGAPAHLRLTGKVIAQIYLGKITKWDDAQIKKLNPKVNLPSTDITPIFRSDGSGTTFNFTDYLSQVYGQFATTIGKGTQVNFPTGVSGRGSSGVSAVLLRTNGGIAYADIAYALANHFQYAAVQNAAGRWVKPNIGSIEQAAATVKFIPADNSISIVDPPKSKKYAYPISTFTFIILPKKTPNAAALKKFVLWAITSGQPYGKPLIFAPVPKYVITRAKAALKQVTS